MSKKLKTKSKRKTKTKSKPARGITRIAAKRGRPASEYAERYQVRHNTDQLAGWLRAAGVAEPGPVLQHWIRTTLDAAATAKAPSSRGKSKR